MTNNLTQALSVNYAIYARTPVRFLRTAVRDTFHCSKQKYTPGHIPPEHHFAIFPFKSDISIAKRSQPCDQRARRRARGPAFYDLPPRRGRVLLQVEESPSAEGAAQSSGSVQDAPSSDHIKGAGEENKFENVEISENQKDTVHPPKMAAANQEGRQKHETQSNVPQEELGAPAEELAEETLDNLPNEALSQPHLSAPPKEAPTPSTSSSSRERFETKTMSSPLRRFLFDRRRAASFRREKKKMSTKDKDYTTLVEEFNEIPKVRSEEDVPEVIAKERKLEILNQKIDYSKEVFVQDNDQISASEKETKREAQVADEFSGGHKVFEDREEVMPNTGFHHSSPPEPERFSHQSDSFQSGSSSSDPSSSDDEEKLFERYGLGTRRNAPDPPSADPAANTDEEPIIYHPLKPKFKFGYIMQYPWEATIDNMCSKDDEKFHKSEPSDEKPRQVPSGRRPLRIVFDAFGRPIILQSFEEDEGLPGGLWHHPLFDFPTAEEGNPSRWRLVNPVFSSAFFGSCGVYLERRNVIVGRNTGREMLDFRMKFCDNVSVCFL